MLELSQVCPARLDIFIPFCSMCRIKDVPDFRLKTFLSIWWRVQSGMDVISTIFCISLIFTSVRLASIPIVAELANAGLVKVGFLRVI